MMSQKYNNYLKHLQEYCFVYFSFGVHTRQCSGLFVGSELRKYPAELRETMCGMRDETRVGSLYPRYVLYMLDYCFIPIFYIIILMVDIWKLQNS